MCSGPTRSVTHAKGRCSVRFVLVGLAAVLSFTVACVGPSSVEISRDRAIEIARSHVSFTPDTVDAMQTTSGTRLLWRVTFRGRLPGQPADLFETTIVELNRVTGEVVSISRT